MCRRGGEEFVILLPQTDIESAAHLAECRRYLSPGYRLPTCQALQSASMSPSFLKTKRPQTCGCSVVRSQGLGA
ncbi:hypothetical protein AB6Q56_17585 [Dechloromonas sp. ARDL1]|uniref:hypothetical protein n=1 Tax=Dechloromonas sp. ARDL1 TaxID=3322121 RepID=UPI003DA6FC7C